MQDRSLYQHARRRRRWALGGMLALIALLVIAGGAVVLRGRDLARTLLDTFVARAGVIGFSAEIRAVGPGGLRLGPVTLGAGGEISAESVAVDWSLWSLLHRRLADVTIEGLHVTLALEDGRLAVEGLPRGRTPTAGFALPAEKLRLANAHVTLSAPAAKVAAKLDATLAPAGDRDVAGEATFDAVITPKDAAPLHILGNLPGWRIGPAAFHLAGGELTSPERALRLSGLALEASLANGAGMSGLSGRLSGELDSQSKPAAWKPLAFAIDAESGEAGLALTGGAKTADNAVVLRLAGRHDFAHGTGSLTLRADPLRFARDGRQPADLFPRLADAVKRVEGTVDAAATLSWRSGRPLASTLAVTLDGVGFEAGAAAIANLRGKLVLDSLQPPHTPAPQCVTATLQFAALPKGPLDLCLGFGGRDRLRIEHASLGFAGGKLALAGVSFAPAAPLDTALKVENVDLGAVLALLSIDGLSGSGLLSGEIPLHLDPAGLAIASGRLSAAGPGTLRYVGAGLPADLGAGQARASETVKLLRDALADFHYTSLALTLDRAADGHGSLLANIKGANPAVLEGRPFALNIRFEADFNQLAALLLGGYGAAEDLLRRAAGQ